MNFSAAVVGGALSSLLLLASAVDAEGTGEDLTKKIIEDAKVAVGTLPDVTFAFDTVYEMPTGVPLKEHYVFTKLRDKWRYEIANVDTHEKQILSFDGKTYFYLAEDSNTMWVSSTFPKMEKDIVGVVMNNPLFAPALPFFRSHMSNMALPQVTTTDAWLQALADCTIVPAASTGEGRLLNIESPAASDRLYFKDSPIFPSLVETKSKLSPRSETCKMERYKTFAIGATKVTIPALITRKPTQDNKPVYGGISITLDDSSVRAVAKALPDEFFRVPRTAAERLWDHDIQAMVK